MPSRTSGNLKASSVSSPFQSSSTNPPRSSALPTKPSPPSTSRAHLPRWLLFSRSSQSQISISATLIFFNDARALSKSPRVAPPSSKNFSAHSQDRKRSEVSVPPFPSSGIIS